MPKLWNETIQEHRHQVREAILRITWHLVATHGVRSVTMSQIAEEVGIGRATLYKYFPDVETILLEWHHRHVATHLEHLTQVQHEHDDPTDQLEAVLGAYALIAFRRGGHGPDLGVLLHRNEQVAGAQQQVIDLFRDLMVEIVATGRLREDVPPEELANYCFHALTAAGQLSSEDAVERLVSVTMAGISRQS